MMVEILVYLLTEHDCDDHLCDELVERGQTGTNEEEKGNTGRSYGDIFSLGC